MQLNLVKTELLYRPDHTATLRFKNGSLVPRKEVVKHLGSLISWKKPFETAFRQRASLAEEAYKKLRLVWNSSMSRSSKLHVFQSTFVPILIYGLDALTLTTPQLQKIDACYLRFLRRVIGIQASFYSRTPNTEVYNRAGRPKLPSYSLSDIQFRMMAEVFNSDRSEVFHSVVFNIAHKDRILNRGRRRGMQFPYWLEVCSKQYHTSIWYSPVRTAYPQSKYELVARQLRDPAVLGKTPERADLRAWP